MFVIRILKRLRCRLRGSSENEPKSDQKGEAKVFGVLWGLGFKGRVREWRKRNPGIRVSGDGEGFEFAAEVTGLLLNADLDSPERLHTGLEFSAALERLAVLGSLPQKSESTLALQGPPSDFFLNK